MNKRDKILEKLRKLMNLKESAIMLGNEGEASAAAAGISRLLMEYNLSETDIPDQEKIDNPIVEERIQFRAQHEHGPWYKDLVTVISNQNLCRTLVLYRFAEKRYAPSEYRIIGRKKNVEIVLYLISFLSNTFIQTGKRNYPTYRREMITINRVYPLTEKMYLKSFLVGCVSGLRIKLAKEFMDIEENTNISSLVVTYKQEIDDFLAGEKIGKARRSKLTVNAEVYNTGIDVGKNVSITKGVCADCVDESKWLK